jgi:Cu(I)/Ag(I) efflux system membrane fusion protein
MYASATIRVRLRADGTPEPTGIEGKYICPMHPEVVQDQAGHCPICEMKLEKVPEAKPIRLPASMQHGPECPEHKHPPTETKHMLAAPESTKVLAVRASAVLDTGRRQVVYRESKPGQYDLVEVQLGPRAEGKDDNGQKASYFPVLAGLQQGDRVVIQGGFLIDSQSQIEGKKSLLFPEGQGGASFHGGHGGSTTKSPESGHKH